MSAKQSGYQDTLRSAAKVALATSSVAAALSTAGKHAEVEEPSSSASAAVVEAEANLLALTPFGTGADDGTIAGRLTGWQRVSSATGDTVAWVPHHLATLAVTLTDQCQSAAGVTPGGASDRFAKAITLSDGDSDAVKIKPGVADVSPFWVLIDTLGFDLIEIELADNASAANANALYRFQ